MEEITEKVNSLMEYREALAEPDQAVFDKLVDYAKGHVVACAKASKLSVLESMLLAILIEQQKLIEHQKEALGVGNNIRNPAVC